ncbi:hypothetical protein GGR52DRAFT_572129 [Hypoxylon sp. FL1284]|nr:hypothetical protein GGR52DRAFT_572129 [Hypoxylon sp. FL1284]
MSATEPSTFFQGSLQDGISLALQQAKVVVAFVADDGDESKEWENVFLTDDTLRAPLQSKAVVLRLQAGSEEAGFLEALFPVPKKPTIVAIQNGMLKEYIASGTTLEDLVRRVAASLNQVEAQAPTPAQNQPSSSDAPSQAAPQVVAQSNNSDDATSVAEGSSSRSEPAVQRQDPQPQNQAGTDTDAQSRARAQALLAERRKRVEAEKKAKEAKEKTEKEAKEKAEKEAHSKQHREVDESNKGQSPDPAERSYAEEVRHRKVQAAEERKRILKRIEDDKRERKEREAQERRTRLLLSTAQDDSASTSHTPPIPLSRRQGGGTQGGEYCNIQVRLFDGSTLRSRFKSDATLQNEVRKWIDEERTDDEAPYTFRVLLTPLPNKVIEPTEEIKSLLSLGLTPSATLVLVRARYATAYAGLGTGNLVQRSCSYIMSIFGSIYSFLFGGIGGMIFGGRGAAHQSTQEEILLQDLNARRAGSRVRGFQQAEDRRDSQLYNGNSLNFEPRRDDDNDGGSS